VGGDDTSPCSKGGCGVYGVHSLSTIAKEFVNYEGNTDTTILPGIGAITRIST
jgi:hypothetical protein